MPPHEAAAAVRLQTDGFVSQAVADAVQRAVDTFRVHEPSAVQHAMRLAANAWALVEAQGALESLASRRARYRALQQWGWLGGYRGGAGGA